MTRMTAGSTEKPFIRIKPAQDPQLPVLRCIVSIVDTIQISN